MKKQYDVVRHGMALVLDCLWDEMRCSYFESQFDEKKYVKYVKCTPQFRIMSCKVGYNHQPSFYLENVQSSDNSQIGAGGFLTPSLSSK